MPKFSGPRLPTGRYYSKRKAGRPKGGKNKPRAKKVTTVAKVRQVAKNAVMSMAETKYFNTTPLANITRQPTIRSRSLATPVNVLAFAVGTGDNPSPGSVATIDYGYIAGIGNAPIAQLNMTRAFGQANSDASLRKNAIDGAYVSPSMCRTEWLIEFPQLATTDDLGNVSAANPMYMRMVRVVPRMKKYSDVDINPKGDLFQTQYGEATGVNVPAFNQLELQMLKVNSRKYQVIQDYEHVFVPSSTLSSFAIAGGNIQVTNLNKSGCKLKLTCNHKQPTKLYYTNVDASGVVADNAQPEAGQSNELIFFHFTSLGTSGNTNTSNTMEITCKTISTFKDI